VKKPVDIAQRLEALLSAARRVRRTEGLGAVLKRAPWYFFNRLFTYQRWYIHEYELSNARLWNESDFSPMVAGYLFRVVSSNEEADALESQGLEFRSCSPYSRQKLDRGGIAFCNFLNNGLVNIAWACTTQKSMEYVKSPPLNINFANGQAAIEGVWTHPGYRGLRFNQYNLYMKHKYLLGKGYTKMYSWIEKGNGPSRRVSLKCGARECAEFSIIRILWWEFWRGNSCFLELYRKCKKKRPHL